MSDARAISTRHHPVADNPLRLLHGDGWGTHDDLRKTAKMLKLLAKRGPQAAKEPRNDLCPRQRTYEDYLSAENAISAGESLTTALVFSVLNWNEPTEVLEKANLLLLEAESLPQGHGHKASLLNEAVKVYDQADLEEWIINGARWAEQQLSTTVDRAAVKKRVHEELKSVLERAISDFGEEIDSAELDLLETLDAVEHIPEIAGLARAIEQAFDRQMEHVVVFFKGTGVLVEVLEKRTAPIPEDKIRELAKMTHITATIFREMKKRPFLRSKLNPEHVKTVTERQVWLAWLLGVEHGRWRDAAQFVQGIREDAVVAKDEVTQQVLRAMVGLAPVLVVEGAPHARNEEIRTLIRRYPLATNFLAKHIVGSAVHQSGQSTAPHASNGPKPVQAAGKSDASDPKLGCITLAILGVIVFVIIAASSGGRKSPGSSYDYTPPTPQPQAAPSLPPVVTPPPVQESVIMRDINGRSYRVSMAEYKRLKPIFDELGRRNTTLEADKNALARLGNQLDADRNKLNRRSQVSIDEFNAAVAWYNTQRDSFNSDIDRFNRDVDAYNTELQRVGR